MSILKLAFPPGLLSAQPVWVDTGTMVAQHRNAPTPLVPDSLNQVSVDAAELQLGPLLALGFTVVVAPAAGTTAQRPQIDTQVGQIYFDTTLGCPVWRNAGNDGWVDAIGEAVDAPDEEPQ